MPKRIDPLQPDPNFEIENEQIEGVLKDLGHLIGGALPAGWVFNLVIASVGKKGSTFYIANMDRKDAALMLQELIDNRLMPDKPRDRYPEITQAVKLLTECATFLAASNTLREDPSELVVKIRDYVENV